MTNPTPHTFTVVAGPPGSPKTMTEIIDADNAGKYGVSVK